MSQHYMDCAEKHTWRVRFTRQLYVTLTWEKVSKSRL